MAAYSAAKENRGNHPARRSPTGTELAVWRRLLDTTAELRRRMATVLSASNLSGQDYEVLLALVEADGRQVRSSELAGAINWERSRLSHHVGRMEKRELVRREECLTDNRGAFVRLTDAGADAFRRSSVPQLQAVKEHFADALTPAQLENLADILDSLQRHFQSDSSKEDPR
ncbi:MarR family winged helix-turn-helix transcriptional regulator [uncultured Arthrobacter sp.]|uniref:MarR family winged helix-turn-helix transcriptional regulator n=1 Tax=uncultured Arthrobacter sp. TaxID=114050 RepID=UPI0025E2AE24|nr:MarR family transcriptional regulator [uncultured Arthrobacter sp.]